MLENEIPRAQTFVIELQDSEVESIEKETKSLWVYGYLSYKDFIGDVHQTRYCARWLPIVRDRTIGNVASGGFIYDPATPREYIKKT